MQAEETVVTFEIGKARFALPVSPVVEILDARNISPLPRTPKHLLGLIDRRGCSVPVVDLRRLLGQADAEDTDRTRIIVLRIDRPEQQRQNVGLRVDHVTEVTQLDDAGSAPLTEAELLRWHERMVAGIGRRGDAFVTVLDVEGLFAGEFAHFAAAGQTC
ncbi:Chemotaxis protein CheW [Roseivivax jejudonensis]|uniref:Chemotaxis protein CheW n=1 Tax=Roseivivax jejudonensis TaxID=1529041 RepID=A0A1X6YKR0_9RHOB|nr:chemotaxis protein CheW [Roseivivax jejudonensis]SLN23488.1 Chemotaxis protein CheW [Roseivivax jejudonensis]